MRRRILTMLLAAGICLGIICSFVPGSKAFSDIGSGDEAEAVSVLNGMGIVSGYSDGGYHPSDALTRSQFCKLAVLLENHADQLKATAYRTLFSDVGSDSWAMSYVNLAYTEGLMQGYGNGTFGPDDPVTCGQAVTVALRVLGYTTDDVGPFWPEDYMAKAATLGLLDGISKTAGQNLSRGEAALLLYHVLKQNTADGREYLATYASSMVSSAVVMDNDAEADDGSVHTAEIYVQNTGSVTWYEQARTVGSGLVGYRGTLLLDNTGKVIGFVPDDNVRKSVAIGDVTASELTDSNGNTYAIPSKVSLVMDGEATTYGEGWYDLEGRNTASIFYSAAGKIDLVVAADNERYEGAVLTGFYENASPSTDNPSEITLAGLTLDVNESALSSIRNFSVGDNFTVVLNAKGEVAAAYAASAKSADLYGVLGNGSVTLTNGLVLSGTVSGSLEEGMLVKVVSSGVGKLTVSAPSSGSSASLDVSSGLLGGTALASDAAIYDHVGAKGTALRISLDDILTDTVSGGRIDFCHKNAAGQVDILLLDDVTGDCYTYGIYELNTISGGSGIMSYTNTYTAVVNSDGTTKSYAALGTADGAVGGLAISDAGTVTGVASLTKVSGVSRSDFDGDDTVTIAGTELPISDEVQVYNDDTDRWVTLSEAKAYTDTFTVYYDHTLTTGAQVRVIIAN